MENIKWVSKLCLVVAICLEIGAIFINLVEGESMFYLFDLADRFSFDNNLFIVYWGSILGILFVSAEAINKFENNDVVKKPNKENINTGEKVASQLKGFTKGFKETFDVPEDPRTQGWKFWVISICLFPMYVLLLSYIGWNLGLTIENEDLFVTIYILTCSGLAGATSTGILTKEFGLMFFLLLVVMIIGGFAMSFTLSF